MLFMFVNAFKDQQKLIDDLKLENKEMKNELNQLKASSSSNQTQNIEQLQQQVKAIQALLNNNNHIVNSAPVIDNK